MDKATEDPALHEVEKMENPANTMTTYANIMAKNKPNPRGPGYIKLYILASVVFLCSTMNGKLIPTLNDSWTALTHLLGFDSSLMGSINALPNYTDYFGLPENGNASTGIVFAIFQVWPHTNE